MADATEKASGSVISIESLIPGITEQVATELREKAINAFSWQVQQAVGEEVKKFIAEQIIPGITEELKARSPELRAAVVAGVFGAMDALAEKVKKTAIDKIAGYDGDKVIREFIGAIYPRY